MQKNIATKWVKALRSGEYKQGYGRLHDTETKRYCCLGILCKIYEKDYVEMGERLTNGFTLPSSIMKDFQVSSPICKQEKGLTIGKERYYSLAESNDKRESFANIADWIENNYALL